MSENRRRGVRASRLRLEQALAQAGLPRATQAALAEHIADLEGLDASPKDLVNRVFREQPVDPQSIERIARGLQVPAHTLYLTGSETEPENTQPEQPPHTADAGTLTTLRGLYIALGLAVIVLAATIAFYPRFDTFACHVRALTSDDQVQKQRLGILIARFDGDSDNSAQPYLADRFLEDATLAPFVSVLTVCDSYALDGPGDRRLRLEELRESIHARLSELGAHVLLWGERRDDTLHVRITSSRTDLSPQRVELGGKPLLVDERYLEIPLRMDRPQTSLPDLKKLTLSLMQLDDATLSDQRDRAIAQFRGSNEWLKASVVTDRNLRSSIDPAVDPTRWALVNAELCYKYRLLGDLEAHAEHYQAAVEACEEVLRVRPQREFPQEWAATQTNLGSAWLRLYAYAENLDDAVVRLRQALRHIEDAGTVIDRERSPQLWAVNRRTLGTIYIRLGELTDDDGSSTLFDKGVATLAEALALQTPQYQPLDWALTQQNICLAQYQHGARLGAPGVDLVREAIGRCEEAASWLSPQSSALSWGMVQNNIAASKATLAGLTGDTALLQEAAEAFRKAQQVYTLDRVPVNWAEVEVNLGQLNCNLALQTSDPQLLGTATRHIEAALRVFIEHGVTHYQRHAEHLLDIVDSCNREALQSCTCD